MNIKDVQVIVVYVGATKIWGGVEL